MFDVLSVQAIKHPHGPFGECRGHRAPTRLRVAIRLGTDRGGGERQQDDAAEPNDTPARECHAAAPTTPEWISPNCNEPATELHQNRLLGKRRAYGCGSPPASCRRRRSATGAN